MAAYLTGALRPGERSRIEAHLAECEACCTELIEVSRLLRTQPRRLRWVVPAGAVAAAAAVVLLVLWPRPENEPGSALGYREPAITTTVAPRVIAPRGVLSSVPRIVGGASTAIPKFTWTSVPRVDQYRLRLFDATGTVMWETQVTDTVVALPDGIRLQPGASYLWKVEAQTGWNRWVGSDLTEFSLGQPRP